MKRPEQTIHRNIVQHLRLRLEKPWIVWHTPNGGGRSKVEGAIFKAMGVLPGIPDLFVLGPNRMLIAVEVKAPKGVLSASQKALFPQLAALGVPVLIVTDAEEAVMALSSLGVPFRGRAM